MHKPIADFAAVAIVSVIGACASILAAVPPELDLAAADNSPVWTEVAWPFPLDQWGRGRAFRCRATDCGTEVDLYLRAKIGFCNCESVIDDDEVDRVGDVALVGGQRAALGLGRPVGVHWMNGRSRGYALSDATAKSALTIAFHDRCDMIVATAAVGSDEPAAQEAAVLKFLNGDLVLRWAEAALGL